MIVLNTAIFFIFCFCYVSITMLIMLTPMLAFNETTSSHKIIDKTFFKLLAKIVITFGLTTSYLYLVSPNHLNAIRDTFLNNISGIYFIFGLVQVYCIFSILIYLQGRKNE